MINRIVVNEFLMSLTAVQSLLPFISILYKVTSRDHFTTYSVGRHRALCW